MPLPTEDLLEVPRRWARGDGHRDVRPWPPDRLELYLQQSPLYLPAPTGWLPAGNWRQLTAADQLVLGLLDPDGSTSRSALLAGLEAGGMTRGYAALHILTSPVIRYSGRARPARLT